MRFLRRGGVLRCRVLLASRFSFSASLTSPPTLVTLARTQEALAAEAWRAALSRAAGEKVYDDPKLLRRSIKREQQEKVRSAKKWQERVSSQQEQQRARQEK
jgi:hypothetical protein